MPASWDLIALIGEGFSYIGQTVTPGLSGDLTQVIMPVAHVSGYTGAWDISIRTVGSTGQPTSSILALETITSAEMPDTSVLNGTTTVNFSSPTSVTAGVPFAIVVNPDPPVHGAGQVKGAWTGTSDRATSHYAGGTDFSGNDGINFDNLDGGLYDLRFQTFVAALPEPTAGFLIAPAFAWIALQRKKPRLAHPDR